jgi:SAM-dependent methyltransferase
MKVVEHATRKNFCDQGYLWMNTDVADQKPDGADRWAWRHFNEHGEREGRRQISADFMDGKAHYRQAKFERFKRILMTGGAGSSGAENFRFFDRDGAFPVVFSDRHYSRGDYVSESSNNSYSPFVQQITAHPCKLYLDLGCGLRDEVYENCLYLEVYPSLTADVIVAPDCQYPIHSESLDGIGCFAVLEHVTKPWQVVAEIHRMLKPGGKAYIVWPFLQPVHGYPSHYYNATREGLKLMFDDGFDIEFCGTEPFEAPNFTIFWVLGKFINSLPAGEKERVQKMRVGDLISQPPMGPFWSDLLKRLPDEVMSEFACGNTLIATKR